MSNIASQSQRILQMAELAKAQECLMEAGHVFAAGKLKWPLRQLTLEYLAYHDAEEEAEIKARLSVLVWQASNLATLPEAVVGTAVVAAAEEQL